MLELRPGTRKFFHMLHQYLHCRELMDAKYEEIDSPHTLATLDVQMDSGGIETDSPDPWEYKASYQQQAVNGNPVNTSEDLYAAASIIKPIYEAKVQNLVARVCGEKADTDVALHFPPLKGRERALEKANDDYIKRKPPTAISWLYDVVRGSIEFATVEQVEQCIIKIQEDPDITIVKAKNRFQNPTLTGYKDFNLHIHIKTDLGFKHVCELQIHLMAMKGLAEELDTHKYYEYFRSYFSGATDSLKDRMDDLKAISDGSDMDEEFLSRFLEKTTDVFRLQRLARMFYDTLCEYDWAYRVYDQVLELQQSSLGDCHVEVAKTFNDMGEILRVDGKTDRAVKLHNQALTICEQMDLDKGSKLWAEIYNNLANAFYSQDKLDEALKLYDKALQILVTNKAENQIVVSVTTNNMANIVYEQGNKDKALELYKSASMIQEKALGVEHPSVAETYANMATVLFYRNKFEEAMQLQIKVLDIRKKILGEKHHRVSDAKKKLAQTHSRLSVRLESKGQFDEALVVLEQELAIRQQMASENERNEFNQSLALKIADVYQNISIVMEKQGNLTVALEILEKSLDIRQDLLNKQHYTVIKTIKQKEKLLQKIHKQ